MEDPSRFKGGVKDFIYQRFLESNVSRPTFDGLSFSQIGFALFEESEVKEAVWDCDGSKCSSPENFNFYFIKRFWDVLKGSFMGFFLRVP